jgi:hypothetical protein
MRKKLIVGILVAVVLLAICGVAYALFTATANSDPQNVNTANAPTLTLTGLGGQASTGFTFDNLWPATTPTPGNIELINVRSGGAGLHGLDVTLTASTTDTWLYDNAALFHVAIKVDGNSAFDTTLYDLIHTGSPLGVTWWDSLSHPVVVAVWLDQSATNDAAGQSGAFTLTFSGVQHQ